MAKAKKKFEVEDRLAEVHAALIRLAPEQYEEDGTPNLDALNSHMKGKPLVDAGELDEIWATVVAEAQDAGPAAAEIEIVVEEDDSTDPASDVDQLEDQIFNLEADRDALNALIEDMKSGTVPASADCAAVLVKSMTNPFTCYIHGRGKFSMRIGEKRDIDAHTKAALIDLKTDAVFYFL